MTDHPQDDDVRPPEETPWWSRPSGETWEAPAFGDSGAESGSDAPTARVPPASPWDAPVPYEPPATDNAGYDAGHAAPQDAGRDSVQDTRHETPYDAASQGGWDQGETAPRSLWAAPDDEADTLGHGPGERGARSRKATLLAAALAVALIAGVAGGVAGFLLARRDNGSVTIDGADLGAAPARSVQRPEGSIASVAAKVLPSVVQIKVSTAEGEATGSGFILDEDGLIVTNNHVVSGARGAVNVSFSSGKRTTARVLGTSASYDLAVLRVKASNLSALPLGNSDSVVVGDPVIAVGSPLGLSGTVTTGIISAKNRPVTAGDQTGNENSYINAVQTDAAINPGNSGGPLVDLDGEVIGVNSAIATVGGSLGGESGNIGVGFAIPINQARRTVEQLINNGEAQFPIIGASLDGTYDGPGARIASQAADDGKPPVVNGGPADKAGLHAGDVITAIDGTEVEGSAELIVAIRSHRPGDTVTLTVKRSGADASVRITLGATKG
jgi:putative serine protease PepD